MANISAKMLCPRCFQSFVPGAESAGQLCPSCAAREAERAEQVMTVEGRVGPVTEEAPASNRATGTPPPGLLPHEEIAEPETLGEKVRQFVPREARAAREWCEGRMPWFRIILWSYLAWTFGRHLISDEPYRSMFDGINLGIHEFGHGLFRMFGSTYLMAAGGTITQLAAPIASLFMFRWQKDFFGLSVGFCWLATNLWGVSVYMADARAQKLPLVAPGMGLMPGGDTSGRGGIIHDWNYLLGPPGLLRYDTIIAGFIATAAVVVMAVGLALGAWLIYRMLISKAGMRLHAEDFR